MNVAVIDDYQHAFAPSPAIARLREKARVKIYTEKFASEADFARELKDVQAIIAIRERTRFSASLLQSLPALELIAQTGNHAYHVDMGAATAAGVVVALAPGDNSVTELTFGLIIAVMRRIPQSDAAMRRGEWPLVLGYVMKGKTLGILGMGKIGVEVAAIGRAFGMKVIAWGPTLTAERAAKSGAEYLPLDDVMQKSDVVSIHLKLSDQSKGLIDERRLRLMKPTSYLVNTARGAIVDEPALARILEQKAIAGAALDVFVEEPLPKTSPLARLDNVVLAPHLGWPTDASFLKFAENAVENVLSYMDGKLVRAINPEAAERRKAKSG
jgi:phosphoglycerate dehydrogenase-like enzyme